VNPEEIPGGIWVFQNVLRGRFAGGLFTTREAAERWIEKNGCSGVLTLYPVDVGVYEWAIEQGLFTPNKPHERAAEFIAGFTTARQPHHHYENGRKAQHGLRAP
jgi:hypothetical protein